MRFMIKEKGGVNAEVFIEFLKRLISVAMRPIILIVDRGPAHIAKKTKVFAERLNGKLRLYFLPPYSLDRNPDELGLWTNAYIDPGFLMIQGSICECTSSKAYGRCRHSPRARRASVTPGTPEISRWVSPQL